MSTTKLTPEQEAIARDSAHKLTSSLRLTTLDNYNDVFRDVATVISDAIARAAGPVEKELHEWKEVVAPMALTPTGLHAELCELENKLQAQSEDTARLNWLEEQNLGLVSGFNEDTGKREWWVEEFHAFRKPCPTARKAIDAARGEEK